MKNIKFLLASLMRSPATLTASQNPQGLTDPQIRAIINHGTGVSRTSGRFALLDRDLNPVNLAVPGKTGDYADITKYVQSATVINDSTQAVHRSLDINMREITAFDFNPLQHLVQVFINFWDTSGNLLLDIPYGIFHFVLPDRTIQDSGNLWKLVGLDLTSKVNRLSFLNQYTIPAGTSYIQAVKTILMMDNLPPSQGGRVFGSSQISNLTGSTVTLPAGDEALFFPGQNIRIGPRSTVEEVLQIGNIDTGAHTITFLGPPIKAHPPGSGIIGQWPPVGNPAVSPAGSEQLGPNIPASRISIPEAYSQDGSKILTTPIAITFGRKDNMLTSINTLLSAVNYYDLAVDENGVFWSAPKPYFTQAVPTLGWTYATGAASIIQAPTAQRFPSVAEIANVVVVESSSTQTTTPLYAIAYNNSNNSAISLKILKEPIVKYISDPNLPNQASCNLKANVELQYAAMLTESVDMVTTPMPLEQTHDYVAINVNAADGTSQIKTVGGYGFELISSRLDLFAHTHAHTFQKIVPL